MTDLLHLSRLPLEALQTFEKGMGLFVYFMTEKRERNDETRALLFLWDGADWVSITLIS